MKRLTPEEIIVLLFAVLSLGGGIALQLMGNSLTLTSIFLAIGIASLVYGFLGGLSGATFAWGALKVGGSLAALLGTFSMLQFYLTKDQQRIDLLRVTAQQRDDLQRSLAVPDLVRYEWQWAGEGWMAHIDVEHGVAKIKMDKFVTCGGALRQLPALEQQGDGKVQLADGDVHLNVSIPVRFIRYKGCVAQGPEPNVKILQGTLQRRIAYAGSIDYQEGKQGDMVLVNYLSSQHY